MSKQLVSVITPLYNHERFVGRCIESLLAQTYTNWELVVVDDGSTDRSGEVVKRFEDSRISYVYQENRGVGALATTINVGLERTSGEFITMLPSDDTWPSYRLDKQVPVFGDENVVMVFGQGLRIDEDDHVIGEIIPPASMARNPNRPLGSALHDMFITNYVFQPSVLIRRSALERVGGYIQPAGLLAEDYPTQMALASKVSSDTWRFHLGTIVGTVGR